MPDEPGRFRSRTSDRRSARSRGTALSRSPTIGTSERRTLRRRVVDRFVVLDNPTRRTAVCVLTDARTADGRPGSRSAAGSTASFAPARLQRLRTAWTKRRASLCVVPAPERHSGAVGSCGREASRRCGSGWCHRPYRRADNEAGAGAGGRQDLGCVSRRVTIAAASRVRVDAFPEGTLVGVRADGSPCSRATASHVDRAAPDRHPRVVVGSRSSAEVAERHVGARPMAS